MLLNKTTQEEETIEDCEACAVDCCLISLPCICKHTYLQVASKDELSAAIGDANDCLEDIVGEDCLSEMCSGSDKFSSLLENEKFKRYYACLIAYSEICNNGYGKHASNGVVIKKGEGYTVSDKAYKFKLEKVEERCERAKVKFLTWWEQQDYDCNSCEEIVESTCATCTGDCNCGEEYDCGTTECEGYCGNLEPSNKIVGDWGII